MGNVFNLKAFRNNWMADFHKFWAVLRCIIKILGDFLIPLLKILPVKTGNRNRKKDSENFLLVNKHFMTVSGYFL